MTTAELKNLTKDEELAFELIQQGKTEDVINLIESSSIRLTCLEKNGMSLLDQACFKGNQEFVAYLICKGANVDNRAHDQGYTCLMWSAMSGKPSLCQLLLDAGARAHAQNSIGKTASELAAFVGQFECVSVISSYISFEDVERIINPKSAEDSKEPTYPKELVQFIHNLTKTHELHPIRLSFNVMNEELVMEHRQKILYTVDRLFERQLRSKEPNEVMSLKLWFILFTLRELLKFIDQKAKSDTNITPPKAASLFAKNILQVGQTDLVKPMEERFFRNAVMAFPYKQSMLHHNMAKSLAQIKLGDLPSAYTVICQCLFGIRYVQTAQFCSTCGISSSQKRCKNCKSPYCSESCMKFDWPIHKKCCEAMKLRNTEAVEELSQEVNEISLKG